MSKEDKMLRDQFAENVRSKELCRELKRMIRQKPSLTFLDVHKEAVVCVKDRASSPDTLRSENPRSMDSEAVTSNQNSDPMLADLLSMVESQERQLTDLTEKMVSLQSDKRQPRGGGTKSVLV